MQPLPFMVLHPPLALTEHDLQTVAAFAAAHAEAVLPHFEAACPLDGRPREAVAAAWAVARGQRRSVWQRHAATAAHRAARETSVDPAHAAARAAGDAAASVYVHPFAAATQVRHLLGAAAYAAVATECARGHDPAVGEAYVDAAAQTAPAEMVEVLRRYPPAPEGRTRAARLMRRLDAAMRGGELT